MDSELQRLFDMVEALQRRANVNAAFGRPVAAEGRTLIPVAEVAYGFGLGFGTAGEGEEQEAEGGAGGGGGAGVRTRPLAVIEVTPETTRVEPLVDEGKIALAGVLLVGWIVFWVARALMHILGKK